jgi:hypothetical protein
MQATTSDVISLVSVSLDFVIKDDIHSHTP